ncbi:MAG: hypothetical protein NTW35_03630 [Candidatus Nomurabacteria bacterium]|nr:hypothetical protein [Candidatus Nomurabacteria bacterium]
MFKKLISKYQKVQDEFFVKQLGSFSSWLDKEIPVERNVYLIETKYISKKVSKSKNYKNSKPSFIFCEPDLSENIFLKINEKKYNWVKIFSHTDYEIYESILALEGEDLPLRFGLSTDEQNFALKLSRGILELEIFKKQIDTKNIFNRFNKKCDVDVTLWCGGKLCGSQIVFGLSLYNGIIDAVKRSYNDERFSKITEKEIKDVRIEVTLLHSLQMPLMCKDIERNIPFHSKAYSATVGKKFGFYLPATFNCVNFKSLEHLAKLLFHEKMSLDFSLKFFNNIFICEVSDYIEDSNRTGSLVLNGSIPQVHNSDNFENNYKKTIDGILNYLERVQNKDGNFLTKVNPLTGLAKDDDFIRLSFTTYALFFYAKFKNDLRSREIAEKSFSYVKSVIDGIVFDSNANKVLTYIYYAKSALFYGDEKEYKKSLEIIESFFVDCPFEPILYSQYVLLLLSEKSFNEKKVEKLAGEVLSSFKDKEKRNEEIDLASYAELPKLLLETSIFSKDRDYFKKESEKIVKWYLDKQNKDGSFYSSTSNTFSYTRGTGKILEVLTSLEGISKEKIEKAFVWSMNMQYNEENNYFIPKDFQSICNGGLRHDYFNQEIWIDGIGHLLIAFTNLDKK